MSLDSPELTAYLAQLNTMANGDPDTQVSMYEVGDALGVGRDEAAKMAETLFMGGHAELKTLSGGIGITAMGQKELGIAPAGGAKQRLSKERVITDPDRELINTLLDETRSAITGGADHFTALESVVFDLKTIEVHLLSPEPKTAVVRELFSSLLAALPSGRNPELSDRLSAALEK